MTIYYDILNNAGFAGMIAVLLAAYLAYKVYGKQKDIDRKFEIKKEVASEILLLQEKVHYTLLIIDRIAYTYQQEDNETDKARIEFFELIKKHEIPTLSDVINEQIPSINIRLSMKFQLYYKKNEKVQVKLKEYLDGLKKWHNTLLATNFSLQKRVKDQGQLSVLPINERAEELIEFVWHQ